MTKLHGESLSSSLLSMVYTYINFNPSVKIIENFFIDIASITIFRHKIALLI